MNKANVVTCCYSFLGLERNKVSEVLPTVQTENQCVMDDIQTGRTTCSSSKIEPESRSVFNYYTHPSQKTYNLNAYILILYL